MNGGGYLQRGKNEHKGTEKKDSDIDIALIFDDFKEEDKFDLQTNLLVLATNFDTRIEPHPISKQEFEFEDPFVSEIKKTGINVYHARSFNFALEKSR